MNIIEYAESELCTFAEKPFGDADSLVLAQFSYNNLSAAMKTLESGASIPLRDFFCAEYFEELFHNVRDEPSNRRLLSALAASPRFRSLRFSHLSEKLSDQLEEQFAAVTVQLDDQTACILFRGTDSTLIGWKEDFNLAFMPCVPSQVDAMAYVNAIGADFPGDLILSGHSKGGNLAVYGAVKCEASVRARIKAVYSHDGPGFGADFPALEAYQEISPRIFKSIPQSSVIGMLLEECDAYNVVESTQSGFMQHDPFSWVVKDGALHTLESITSSAKYMDKTLNAWIAGMSVEERARFVDALYTILTAGNISNAFEIDLAKSLPAMYSAAVHLDPQTRSFVFQTVKNLAGMAVKNVRIPNPLTAKETPAVGEPENKDN